MDFKEGALVRLKSGGPSMTVQKVNRTGIVCAWFVKEALKTATFQPDALVESNAPMININFVEPKKE